MASQCPTEERNDCYLAARMNAVRSKGDSEQWFSHENAFLDAFKVRSRIRPEAAEIVAKNRDSAGNMGLLVGFTNDLCKSDTTPVSQRLRSSEAKAIAQKMTRSTENWADFEDNLVAGSKKQPSHRFGASVEAKEIMQSQTKRCDWLAHSLTPVGADPKLARPSTKHARNSACDLLTHDTTNQSGVDVRRSLRRVRGEGEEYAKRNEGRKDLLSTISAKNLSSSLYHCPTKESQNYCRRNKESNSVAECMKDLTQTEKTKSEYCSVKTRSADFSEWHENTNTFYGHRSVSSVQTHNKVVPRSEVARCIIQADKYTPPTPREHMLHVYHEAKSIYHKNRNGQMADLIGSGARSTTLLYPGKIQTKSVKSKEAKSNQEKARGNAVRTLLTHTDLRETPPKHNIHAQIDQVKFVLEGNSVQPMSSPPSRLMSAEARSYADRQRGTMRDLLTYG